MEEGASCISACGEAAPFQVPTRSHPHFPNNGKFTWDEMKVTVHLCEIHYGAYLNDGDETMLRGFIKQAIEAETGGEAA